MGRLLERYFSDSVFTEVDGEGIVSVGFGRSAERGQDGSDASF